MDKKIASLIALSLLLLTLVPATSSAMPYSRLYVFGDSLSDVGNSTVFAGGLLPLSPPYYRGHYSNGPVAAEWLANNYLGTTLTPSLWGGNNYAVAGATTGTANYVSLLSGFTGMQNQVQAFARATPAFNPNTTLFMVWGGANDFFLSQNANAVAPAITNLASDIVALANVGARHFLVPNLPNLGITPFGRSLGPAGSASFSALSQAYDVNLNPVLTLLRPALGVDIVAFNVAGALSDVIANAGSYGFTNTTDACVTIRSICANPNEYLFWDSVHPTTHAHAILANRFAAAIPEPSDFSLLLAGGAALALVARRRKAGVPNQR